MHIVRVIAHRGAHSHAPENSLDAFALAADMGVDMVETDVRATADGHAVLMHDETLDRTTDLRGKVSSMTLAGIREACLSNGEPVPTLAETLELLAGRCPVNLELKDTASVAPACEDVARLANMSYVLFSSFDISCLAEVRRRVPRTRLAVLSDDRRSGYLEAALSLGAESVNLSARIASARAIGEAHTAGLEVNVWTVNRPDLMQSFLSRGADGIITDRPELLLNILGRRLP